MPFRGVIVAEGEPGEVVSFDTDAELEAYSQGTSDAVSHYGAGSCFVVKEDELDALEDGEGPDDVEAARVARMAFARADRKA